MLLVCYFHFQIFELHQIFKRSVSCLYVMILYCILVMRYQHIYRVFFRFLALSGKVVPSKFDTFWGESAKLSFMTKVLTFVALEWATLSSIVFYVYSEAEDTIRSLMLSVFCSSVYIMICRGKNRELLCCRFLLYVFHLSCLPWITGYSRCFNLRSAISAVTSGGSTLTRTLYAFFSAVS
jgi:hypothetical protein